MNKSIIAAAIAVAVAAPAANAGVTIYGKIHASIDSRDVSTSGWDTGAGDWYGEGYDQWNVTSRRSRIGFKGTEDLGNGLSAIWLAETGYDITDGGAWDSGVRQSYIGLTGSWGTFAVGKQYVPYKLAMMGSGVENMSDTTADTSDLANLSNQGSVSNAIAYVTPNMNGLTGAIAIVPGEGSNGNDGLADTISAGVMYSNNGLYLGAGYQQAEGGSSDPTWWNVSASYTIGNFKIAGAYEDLSNGAPSLTVENLPNNTNFIDYNTCNVGSSCDDGESWAISATYTMGNNAFKATYGHHENDGGDAGREQTGWGVGAFHSFSKRTQAYVAYSNELFEDHNSGNPDGEIETSEFSIGLMHNF